MALLVLAAEYRKATGVSLRAITIDHGLRAEARNEADFVGHACNRLGVQHDVMRWERQGDGPVSQDEARRARHVLLAQWASSLGINRIALGHTRDDRLETFLMRARQGSGWHGLAGPTPNSVSPVWPEGRLLSLMRPLLAFGRDELRAELATRSLSWVEDPSNDALRFERVRMRQLLGRMTPSTRQKALTVMNRLMQLRAGVASEARSLFVQLRANSPSDSVGISLKARESVGAEAWLRFVEAMVMAAGGAERGARREGLNRLLHRIAAGDPQLGRGVTLGGAKIRILRDGFPSFSRAPPRHAAPVTHGEDAPDWGRAGALLAGPDLRVLAV